MAPKKGTAKKAVPTSGTGVAGSTPAVMPSIILDEPETVPYETCVYHEKHEPKNIMSNEIEEYEEQGWTTDPGTLKTKWINTMDNKWIRKAG